MWVLSLRRPVHCNAPDNCAGQPLRSGEALLMGNELMEGAAQRIVATE